MTLMNGWLMLPDLSISGSIISPRSFRPLFHWTYAAGLLRLISSVQDTTLGVAAALRLHAAMDKMGCERPRMEML